MSNRQPPSVQLVQQHDDRDFGTQRRRWGRWQVFVTVLVVTALIGIAIVFSRTPVYRAATSVLTVKPKAVNAPSVAADIQHVAIQKRLLLSEALLKRLADQVQTTYPALDVAALRSMLSVAKVPETNLLELRAEGSEPDQLADVVNRWADAYETYRIQEIALATGRTTAELEDQQQKLAAKVADAREQLAGFRRDNQIVGLEAGDNQALSSLRGLNQSLNKARERLIEARAKQAALQDADRRGKPIAPESMKSRIADMRLALSESRARLAQLQTRYTKVYIESDPKYRDLPGRLRSQQNALAETLKLARKAALDEADEAVVNAQAAVSDTQQKLTEQQGQVQRFNDAYQQFKTLKEDLTRLERLQADNAEKLARIEVMNLKKFPPIQIVDPAGVPSAPIWPDYQRDLLIALGAAFALALFATWLVDYLSGRARSGGNAPRFDVNIYTGEQSPALESVPQATPLPQQPPQPGLNAPATALPMLPRELGGSEVHALLQYADPNLGAHIALLLSGVSPFELPMLNPACFDAQARSLQIPGTDARHIPLADTPWQRVLPLADQSGLQLSLADLDRQLMSTAHSSRLNAPETVNALALWHTYLLHLARQGATTEQLTGRAGRLPPDLLANLLRFAPPANTNERAIDFTYPALAS